METMFPDDDLIEGAIELRQNCNYIVFKAFISNEWIWLQKSHSVYRFNRKRSQWISRIIIEMLRFTQTAIKKSW